MARNEPPPTEVLGPAGRFLGPPEAVLERWMPTGHAGLLFDRYLPLWATRNDYGAADVEIPKGVACRVLAGFAERYNQRKDHAGLLQARHRHQQALADLRGGLRFQVRLQAPLAQGMGLDHPTGNGFLFDPVLGVPWLPGTALKGLCRQWARLTQAEETAEVHRILGPDPEDARCHVGTVTFLDAYPESWPRLEVGVLTPHYSSYYSWLASAFPKTCQPKKIADSPHGMDDPVPVHHLTVAPDQTYAITLLPANGSPPHDCTRAREWLSEALSLLGAGARTAVGHGVFQGISD